MAAILADDIFKCIFLNEHDTIAIQISLKHVPRNPIDNKPGSIGSGNGLAPNRRQAIIWTDDDPVHWRIYAALGGDELINHWWPSFSLVFFVQASFDNYKTKCWFSCAHE